METKASLLFKTKPSTALKLSVMICQLYQKRARHMALFQQYRILQKASIQEYLIGLMHQLAVKNSILKQ
jgi:hypothetical protein